MINMNFELEVSSTIDIPKHLAKLESPEFRKFTHTEWNRLIFPFVPFNTGALAESVIITAESIEYRMPYATAVYMSNRNFRKDLHPLASSKWDKAAEPTEKPKLIEALQKYVDSGRLKL